MFPFFFLRCMASSSAEKRRRVLAEEMADICTDKARALMHRGSHVLSKCGVACGEDHTLALDDEGRVWAWGRGEHGQLFGAADRQFTAPPKPSSVLTGREGAVAVAAAGHCSCSRLVGGATPRCTGKCSQRARQLLLCQMGLDGA